MYRPPLSWSHIALALLAVMAVVLAGTTYTKGSNERALAEQVAALEQRIQTLESVAIVPANGIEQNTAGFTQIDGLFAGDNQFHAACSVVPLAPLVHDEARAKWPQIDTIGWRFLTCVRTPSS